MLFFGVLALPTLHSIHLKDWENEILDDFPPTPNPHKHKKVGSTTAWADQENAQFDYDLGSHDVVNGLSFDTEEYDHGEDADTEWIKPVVERRTRKPVVQNFTGLFVNIFLTSYYNYIDPSTSRFVGGIG